MVLSVTSHGIRGLLLFVDSEVVVVVRDKVTISIILGGRGIAVRSIGVVRRINEIISIVVVVTVIQIYGCFTCRIGSHLCHTTGVHTTRITAVGTHRATSVHRGMSATILIVHLSPTVHQGLYFP